MSQPPLAHDASNCLSRPTNISGSRATVYFHRYETSEPFREFTRHPFDRFSKADIGGLHVMTTL